MKKKLYVTLFLFLTLLLLLANSVFASYSTVTMEVVEEPICTINFGENSKFEKKLISKDLANKEVTLQLQVTNEEVKDKATGEVVILIDNSDSMEDPITVNGTSVTRKDLVFSSAKKLVSDLMQDNTSLEIAIASFSTSTTASQDGTSADARLEQALTNNTDSLLNAISNIEAVGPRTDLDAGLVLANEQFSTKQNSKYLIVLTDGIPNISLGNIKPYYSDTTITQTKNRLSTIGTNVNVLSMLVQAENPDLNATGTTKTFRQIATEIFGTNEAPATGKFYYVTDAEIENTITNEIYSSLVDVDKTFTDIQIVDYFPKEIIDNFDFAYVTEASKGEISAEVNKENNSITWTIPSLAIGETATVQYKLKLKENFDSSIVGKILNTNEKVDLTYTDYNNQKQDKTSDVTPKLKLTEPPPVLPKAGSTTLIITFVILVSILVVSLVKWRNLNNQIK